jgi:hypothetical protein
MIFIKTGLKEKDVDRSCICPQEDFETAGDV